MEFMLNSSIAYSDATFLKIQKLLYLIKSKAKPSVKTRLDQLSTISH